MEIFIYVTILIFSVMIHEVAHGLVAYWLGDPTAKYAGRLTLNPISHLDPIGSVVLPLLLALSGSPFLFGWAKPVPYNPYNLKSQKYGPALVGVAGPASNILLALIAGVIMRVFLVGGLSDSSFVFSILTGIIFVNILLFVFNLLPIPPLDGSKLLFAILPISENTKMMLDRYGIVLVFVFIYLFQPVINFLFAFVFSLFSNFVVGINLLEFLKM